MASLIFWILLAIAVIVLDIATSSFLFVWFALGAFIAMLADLLGASVGVQIVTFLVVSIITVSVGYPWARKKFKSSVTHTPLMEEKYIGRVMVAEEGIKEKSRVKVDGIYWTIKNKGGEIKKGEKFKITEIEGNKLIVKKEEES
ncbi:NfeD family protein [Clostridium carnis]